MTQISSHSVATRPKPAPIHWAGLTLVLAALYFATGYGGLFLALPPGNITLVWPPSGIAFAAVLLTGWRAVPGIVIGAAALNALSFFDSGSLGSVLATGAGALVAAGGAAVQFLAAVALFRRLGLIGNYFASVGTIARSLAALGLACLISSSIGVATLTVLGLVQSVEIARTWGTWWLGDLMGILLFAPVAMALGRQALGTIGLLALVLVVGIGGTYIASTGIRTEAEAVWENKADIETGRLTATLLQWIETSLTPIHAMATLFQSSNRVIDDEFWDAVTLLEDNQQDFFPSSLVIAQPVELDDGKTWKVVYSIEDEGRMAGGSDLGQEPALARAVKAALDRPGQTVIGGAYRDDAGSAWLVPVIAVEADVGRQVILGLVDLNQMVDGLFKTQAPDGIEMRLSARAAAQKPEAAVLLYGPGDVAAGTVVTKSIRGVSGYANFTFLWDIKSAFRGGKVSQLADVVLLGGVLATALLSLFINFLLRQNEQTRALVQERTAELRLALDNMPGGMFMIDKDLNFRVCNDRYSELYGLPGEAISPGGSLRAMVRARAERGDYGRGDVDELIEQRIESYGTGQTEREEERLPNGRVVEFLRQPTDDGGTIGVVTDVTERVKSEETARSLREAIEGFTDSIILYDQDERVVFTNDKYHELYSNSPPKDEIVGYTQEQLLRRSLDAGLIDDALAKTDPEKWLAGRLDERRQNRFLSGETVHSTGRILMIRHRPTSDGGLIVAHTDITERKLAENEAAQLLGQLNATVDSLPDGILLLDEDLNLITFNDLWRELFDFPEELARPGENVARVLRYQAERGDFGDGPIEDLVEQRLKAFRSAEPFTYERELGNGRIVTIRGNPVPEVGLVLSYTDITDRKRAEQALKESEQRLIAMLAESPVGVAIAYEGDSTLAYANSRMDDMFGYSVGELIGQQASVLYMDAEARKPVIERYMRDGIVEDVEMRTRRADGSDFWCLVSFYRFELGGQQARLGWFYDITERKKAEDRFKSLLESAPDATVIIDVDGTIVQTNQQSEKLFGYATEDLVGQKVEALLPHRFHDQHPDHRRDYFEHARVRPMGIGLDLYGRAKDGREFPIEISLSPIEVEGGIVVSAAVRDITARKQAEEDLRQAKEHAEAALADLTKAQQRLVTTEKMASLGQLTAGIAHEIKNPLNFVTNFSETSVELLDELAETLGPVQDKLDKDIRDDVDDIVETLKGDLQKINHHGKRADGIVKSMLLHARGDAAERVPASINGLVEEALNLSYHGERARDKSFQVTMDTDLCGEDDTAEIVPQEITRVLVNLINNAFYAVKKRSAAASPDDYTPRVAVSTQNTGEDILIRIRDNGTGMPEDVREKLFDPFFTTKPTGEGTGLGLSMSFDIIVHQHDGQIDVASEPGEFTEFAIRLPIGQTDDGRGATSERAQ